MGIVYHYCSTNTFRAIIETKQVFLSSLWLSNDSQEGKIIIDKMLELADFDKLAGGHRAVVKYFINSINEYYHCGALCLSLAPDLLSQWRGYADDGHGVSIGFSSKQLRILIDRCKAEIGYARIESVIYDEKKHSEFALRAYRSLKSAVIDIPRLKSKRIAQDKIAQGTLNETVGLDLTEFLNVVTTASDLFLYKSDAFSEEQEQRLICDMSRSVPKLNYRNTRNTVVPYRILDLKMTDMPHALIREVILGPKNITPERVAKQFLIDNGFVGAKIKKSTVTYR